MPTLTTAKCPSGKRSDFEIEKVDFLYQVRIVHLHHFGCLLITAYIFIFNFFDGCNRVCVCVCALCKLVFMLNLHFLLTRTVLRVNHMNGRGDRLMLF